MVVPILAPNMIDIPNRLDNKLLKYIFCATAIVVEEDWIRKDIITPAKMPSKGLLNLKSISSKKLLLKTIKRCFVNKSRLKKINPMYKKTLERDFLIKRRINVIMKKI